MTRAPFQVLVLPFRRTSAGTIEYALFQRRDAGYWQGIAGGGENDESPLAAAVRESEEEAGIPRDSVFCALDAVGSAPVTCIDAARRADWPPELEVIPIHAFGADATGTEIRLSNEHTEYVWCLADAAHARLHWDSDKAALRELDERLRSRGSGNASPPNAHA